MKTIIAIIILLFPFAANAKSYGDFEGAQYVRNYDADTITFNLPGLHPIIGEGIRVRLRGVDTPEIRGKCEKEKILAIQAREFVAKKLMAASEIYLSDMERDTYYRIDADVILDIDRHRLNLKTALLDNGYGVPYKNGTKTSHDWCK